MLAFPQFTTHRLFIRHVQPKDAEAVLRYYQNNRRHLAQWEPIKPKDFYDLEACRQRLTKMQEFFINDSAVHFLAFDRQQDQLAAIANFTGITRAAFQACYLGFSVSEHYQSQGVMREFLPPCLNYMLGHKNLNRIMANHLPHNERSAKLLQHLGFEKEGYAKRYLKIAGVWQDHILRAKVRPAADSD